MFQHLYRCGSREVTYLPAGFRKLARRARRQGVPIATHLTHAIPHRGPLVTHHAQPPTTIPSTRKGPCSDSTRRSSPDASARIDSPPVMTCRATHPRRLALYPSFFKFNYLSKIILGLLPLPSDKHRKDRTEYRSVNSDDASGPSLSVSNHFWPFPDDCSAVYSDVD